MMMTIRIPILTLIARMEVTRRIRLCFQQMTMMMVTHTPIPTQSTAILRRHKRIKRRAINLNSSWEVVALEEKSPVRYISSRALAFILT